MQTYVTSALFHNRKLFVAAYFHCTTKLKAPYRNKRHQERKRKSSKAGNDFSATSLRSQISLRNACMWHSSSTKAPFPRDRPLRSTKPGSLASDLSHRSTFNLDRAVQKLLLTPSQHLSVLWRHAGSSVKWDTPSAEPCNPSPGENLACPCHAQPVASLHYRARSSIPHLHTRFTLYTAYKKSPSCFSQMPGGD